MLRALALLLIVSPTSALGWNFCASSIPIPPEYAHEPTIEYQVMLFPPEWIPGICESAWEPWQVIGGCASEEAPGKWWIRIRNNFTPSELACALAHEKAHVNGWVHPELTNSQRVSGSMFRRTFNYYTPSEFLE